MEWRAIFEAFGTAHDQSRCMQYEVTLAYLYCQNLLLVQCQRKLKARSFHLLSNFYGLCPQTIMVSNFPQ